MKKWLFVLLLLMGTAMSVAQPGKVYKSLKDVKNPEDVYILKLNWKRLREIPPEVFTFTNLQELDLTRNNIDSIPSDIVRLQHLRVLSLGRNLVRHLPIEIGLLAELRELDLNRNPIAELPESVAYLTHLQKLILWGTGVERLPESFAALDATLQLLDLRSCALDISDQEQISTLLPSVKKKWDQACNCR